MQNEASSKMGTYVAVDGAKVRAYRMSKGWSQEELAQVSGVAPRTVQRLEAGTKASFDTLKAIAAAFDVDLNSLLLLSPPDAAGTSEAERHDDLRFFTAPLLKTGKEVLDCLVAAHAYDSHYDEPRNDSDFELMKEILEFTRDLAEIWGDVGVGNQMDYCRKVDTMVKDLDSRGYAVFGNSRPIKMSSETGPFAMSVATLFIKNKDAAGIRKAGDSEVLVFAIPADTRMAFY